MTTLSRPKTAPVAPPHPYDSFRWQACILLILVTLAYANSLGSSFHFDDTDIFSNRAIVNPGFGLDIFGLHQTRPLTYLTFHWNFLADGQNPFLYHCVNLLLHAANTILLLAIARRYLSASAAGFAALIFALHPLQTESVTYVFARSTLLSTHFALWTIWLFAREKYLASAAMFGVSLLAKEEAIALPGFLLLLDLFARRRPNLAYFATLLGLDALAAGRLFYLILTAPVAPGIGRVHGLSTAQYFLTQLRVLWIYLRLMIAPVSLNLDRDVPVSHTLLDPPTTLFAAVGVAALLASLCWLAWVRKSPAALWAVGFFVLILPSSSIVAQADMIYEHRTYLPMVCAVIALGFLLASVSRKRLALAAYVLIPVMLAGTVSRNADWYNEKTLWTDIALKSPNKGRSWLGLARAYDGEPERVREYLMKGLSVDPGSAELHTNYGIALLSSGQSAEALDHFLHALALSEPTADRWNNIGGAYFRLNNRDAAMASFQTALQLDPCNFASRRNVMMLYSQRNDLHGVWQTGELPRACQMIPDQAGELQRLRKMAGKP